MQSETVTPPVIAPRHRSDDLQQAATALEASFLAEMLRGAGLSGRAGAFGGGAGEDQFTSFLVEEQARRLAAAGGLGLAETIFNSLKERGDD